MQRACKAIRLLFEAAVVGLRPAPLLLRGWIDMVAVPTTFPGSDWLRVGLFALALIAVLLSQGDAMHWMWETWLGRPEYSHGLLLPVLAGWLLWLHRADLRGSDGDRRTWRGVAVLVLGALIAFAGDLATIYTISQYGTVLMVVGLLIAWLGWEMARRLWIVSVLLLLAVPLPNFVLNNMSFEMQLLSSQAGVAIARLLGVTVFVDGNVIDLGTQKLQVAEACDGLRYIFPLLTLGFLMAYCFRVVWWKRALVFAATIPLAIAMNALRVALIVVMVDRWGPSMAEGFFHEFQGWIMFMVCAATLFGLVVWLARVGSDAADWRAVFGFEPPSGKRFGAGTPLASAAVGRPLVGALCLSLCFLVAGALAPARVDAVPARTHLTEWPLRTGEWIGRRDALDAVYLDVLQLDDYLLADYRRSDGLPVNLYVAYYDSQRSGASAHSPRSCIPGGGWKIRGFDGVALQDVETADGKPLNVNRVVIEHGMQRQIVYYWFEQRGRVVTNEYLVKWFIFWDALTRQRTDGALVRLTVPVAAGQSELEAELALRDFARAVVPKLRAYVPG